MFGPAKRPIVMFAWENVQALKKRADRFKSVVANKVPSCAAFNFALANSIIAGFTVFIATDFVASS